MTYEIIYEREGTLLILVNKEDIVEMSVIESFAVISSTWTKRFSEFKSIGELVAELDVAHGVDCVCYGLLDEDTDEEMEKFIEINLKHMYYNESR